jgi:hypothetical protein
VGRGGTLDACATRCRVVRGKFAYSIIAVGRSTYLLIGLIALLCAYPFLLDASWQHRLLLGSLNVAILVAATRAATQTNRAFLLVVVFLGLPSIGLQAAYLLTNNMLVGDLFFLACALFYLFTITHVLRYVLAVGEVTTDKIHGAIAAYILIGLLWASIYVFLDTVHPGSFAFGAPGATIKRLGPEDLLYFSFVTLTTTGYGDIAPVTAHARSLAILEQLAGTFYIAILIARLTGLYQGRRTRGPEPE